VNAARDVENPSVAELASRGQRRLQVVAVRLVEPGWSGERDQLLRALARLRELHVLCDDHEIAWTQAASLPRGREYHGVTVFGDRIWVAGGKDDPDTLGDVLSTTDGTAWTPMGMLPVPRRDGVLVAFRDRIVSLGGSGLQVWASTDGAAWTALGALPAQRSHARAAAFTPR
jgi:hypothetical protein